MRTLQMPAIAAVVALVLAACGGGGHSNGDPTGRHPNGDTDQYRPRPFTGLAFPLTGDVQRVGIDQAGVARLPVVAERGDNAIRFGSFSDGAGRAAVAAYLTEANPNGVQRFASAPSLRIIGPATDRERRHVHEAVAAVNLSLPPEYRIRVEASLPALSLKNTIHPYGFYSSFGAELPNTIHVEFLPCADYYDCGGSGGTTWTRLGGATPHVYMQLSRGVPAHRDDRLTILAAHELLHALGMDTHVSGVDSILLARGIYRSGPATVLKPIDREALQAFYRRLQPGDDAASFGPWSSSSMHIAGNGPHANFGVALRNGYAEAWAHGVRPTTALAHNRVLSGQATWNGALVGLTPAAEAVAGGAEIGVNLSTMRGSADFTALESWAARAAPGAAGTGTRWLDGDLAYTISVTGNAFRETGGDDGRLNGIFTGRSHEGAAGTLERSDLTAAFGAAR